LATALPTSDLPEPDTPVRTIATAFPGHPVNHIVGDLRRDDFTLERVTLHTLSIALANWRGKVAH